MKPVEKPFKVHIDINIRSIHINFSISAHFHIVTFIGLAACVLPLGLSCTTFYSTIILNNKAPSGSAE